MKAMKLTQGQTAAICRELSLLLGSGLPLADSTCLLEQEAGETRAVFAQLTRELDQGATLAEAMVICGVFPGAVSGMVRIGETTGHLQEALEALAEYYDENEKLTRQIRTALVYPSLILLLMLVVVGVLLAFVLPVFDRVYASMGGGLTGISAGLLRLGQLLRGGLPGMLVLLAVIAAGAAVLCLRADVRQKAAGWFFHRFGDRGIGRNFQNARILRGLSLGIRSGLREEEAMNLTLELLGDSPGGMQRVKTCLAAMEEGASLSYGLVAAQLLSPAGGRLLAVGNRCGSADRVLNRIAEDAMEEARRSLEDLVSRVEPAMVLFVSALVGVILLSAVLPLMNILASLG